MWRFVLRCCVLGWCLVRTPCQGLAATPAPAGSADLDPSARRAACSPGRAAAAGKRLRRSRHCHFCSPLLTENRNTSGGAAATCQRVTPPGPRRSARTTLGLKSRHTASPRAGDCPARPERARRRRGGPAVLRRGRPGQAAAPALPSPGARGAARFRWRRDCLARRAAAAAQGAPAAAQGAPAPSPGCGGPRPGLPQRLPAERSEAAAALPAPGTLQGAVSHGITRERLPHLCKPRHPHPRLLLSPGRASLPLCCTIS